jgi:hypothetical protein
VAREGQRARRNGERSSLAKERMGWRISEVEMLDQRKVTRP